MCILLTKEKIKLFSKFIFKVQLPIFTSFVLPQFNLDTELFAYDGSGVVIQKNTVIGNSGTTGQGITMHVYYHI